MLQFEYSPDRTIEKMTDTADTRDMTNNENQTPEPEYLSMPDPCPHVTRIDVIRARLHGESDVFDHLETCPAP